MLNNFVLSLVHRFNWQKKVRRKLIIDCSSDGAFVSSSDDQRLRDLLSPPDSAVEDDFEMSSATKTAIVAASESHSFGDKTGLDPGPDLASLSEMSGSDLNLNQNHMVNLKSR